MAAPALTLAHLEPENPRWWWLTVDAVSAGGNTSELLDGLLDEVALSPEDMKDLMKKGFKGILDVAALNILATS